MPESTALRRPTKQELLEAHGKTIADVLAPGLQVLFCGINPGLYSGYTGYHFARPGNRFWPALYAAGFTKRQLKPAEQDGLLAYGYGVTNLVARATATAAELTLDELVEGGRRLRDVVQRFQPRVVAVLGITAYRAAFDRPYAVLGQQDEHFEESALWVLPNPSGLNAHYTPDTLAQVFRAFRLAIERA